MPMLIPPLAGCCGSLSIQGKDATGWFVDCRKERSLFEFAQWNNRAGGVNELFQSDVSQRLLGGGVRMVEFGMERAEADV